MALTGFNPEVVNQSISSVKTSYENLMRVLADDIQNQFVNGMADKWACNQAITFFSEQFKPSIDSLVASANVTFESVVASMNSAAQAWANETNSAYSPSSFSPITKQLDVSAIQENIGGVRGIDFDLAGQVVAKLPTIAESAKSALTSAQNAVQNCGFIGGSQSANLANSLTVIKNKIDAATTDITSSAKSAIDNTINSYSNTEGKISQAFSGQN